MKKSPVLLVILLIVGVAVVALVLATIVLLSPAFVLFAPVYLYHSRKMVAIKMAYRNERRKSNSNRVFKLRKR